MNNPNAEAILSAQKVLEKAFLAAQDDGSLPACEAQLTVEPIKDVQFGDFVCNAAMALARPCRMAPRKIAETILAHADFTGSCVGSAEIAGPGFINLRLSESWWNGVLTSIEEAGDRYGRTDHGQGKKVMVEFVSANPTGPMHIGNARGGALGDILASCLDMAGYNVWREFYINDAGNQIHKFGLSLEARYMQQFDAEYPFPEDGYHGADITERAQEFAALHGDAYVNADVEARAQALVDYALPLNIEGLRRDLAAYRIEYDEWFPESVLHADGTITKIIDLLASKGLTYEQDGALWYRATMHGGEKDEVLVRKNGTPTYFAADIAYHYNKFAVRGFDTVINVWGADHHGHVARLKGAMDAIGLDGDKLEIVLMQLVRLMRNGESVRVSKRTGKSITLATLLDDIPVDAARFFFNLREPGSQFEFDLDLAVEQSSQNPVYYVQYAHARICSLLKKAAEQGVEAKASALDRLNAPEERELIRLLASLPNLVIEAADSRDPAILTRFSTNAAAAFHKFYNAHYVLDDDRELAQSRLFLCKCTATALRNVLSALKINAPESM